MTCVDGCERRGCERRRQRRREGGRLDQVDRGPAFHAGRQTGRPLGGAGLQIRAATGRGVP